VLLDGIIIIVLEKRVPRLLEFDANERLLRAITEQLKLPLLKIARASELTLSSSDVGESTRNILEISNTALKLLDGYLMSIDNQTQETLQLEPVSVSSVLEKTAHGLAPLARQNECELKMSISGRYAPVMAHQPSLESALFLLGVGMIESVSPEVKKHQVVLSTYKTATGTVAGVFDNLSSGVDADGLRRGKALFGSVKQSIPSMSGANGAGVFVADALFRAMDCSLRVARHNKFSGLAATLHPSTQLSLI